MKWHCEHSNIRLNSQEYSSRVHIYRIISKLLIVIKETKQNLKRSLRLGNSQKSRSLLAFYVCSLQSLQSRTSISAEKCFPFFKNLTNTDCAIKYLKEVYMGKTRNGQAEDLTLAKAKSAAGKWREFNPPPKTKPLQLQCILLLNSWTKVNTFTLLMWTGISSLNPNF